MLIRIVLQPGCFKVCDVISDEHKINQTWYYQNNQIHNSKESMFGIKLSFSLIEIYVTWQYVEIAFDIY